MYIDLDKPITLEAAKFLGVPFAFRGGTWAFKFKHTDAGLVLYSKYLLVPNHRWEEERYYEEADFVGVELYLVRRGSPPRHTKPKPKSYRRGKREKIFEWLGNPNGRGPKNRQTDQP